MQIWWTSLGNTGKMIMQLLHTLGVLLGADQFSKGLFILAQGSVTHIALVHSYWPGPLKAVDLHRRKNGHLVACCTLSFLVWHQMKRTQTCLSNPVVSMLDWHLFKDKLKTPPYVNWAYFVLDWNIFVFSLVWGLAIPFFQWVFSTLQAAKLAIWDRLWNVICSMDAGLLAG